MERLRERLDTAAKALSTLDEVDSMRLPPVAARDVAILRFIYTFEAMWRALQRYLAVVEGVELATPKACMRGARDAKLLADDQTEAALAMVNDRNLSVHIYKEELAEEIMGRLPHHLATMKTLLHAMTKRVGNR